MAETDLGSLTLTWRHVDLPSRYAAGYYTATINTVNDLKATLVIPVTYKLLILAKALVTGYGIATLPTLANRRPTLELQASGTDAYRAASSGDYAAESATALNAELLEPFGMIPISPQRHILVLRAPSIDAGGVPTGDLLIWTLWRIVQL